MLAARTCLILGCLLVLSPVPACAEGPAKQRLPNPFYAMDTAFQRPGLSADQQLDLVKELGYAGIAWTETSPEQATSTAERAEHGCVAEVVGC